MSTKQKKLLFVNSCLSDGGAERVMTCLANEFANRGNIVKMILIRPDKADTYVLNEQIVCERYEYKVKNKGLKWLSRISRLHKEMKTGDYDAVIAFPRIIAYMVLLASFNLKVKVIVSERNDPSDRLKSFVKRNWELFLYRKASNVVFQTGMVMNMYPLKVTKKGVVIPNPIHEGIPKPYEGQRSNTVVAAGRLNRQKNFPMLIKAFAKFHQNHQDYKLIIYGQGDLKDELTQLIKSLGIEDCVEMPGYAQNVEEKMNCCKMYVSSSDYEGISNTMLEAMALGMPAICTDCPVGGAKAMITDSVNGLLVPIKDDEALYRAMCRVADDDEFAAALGKAAYEINKQYSVEAVTDMWDQLITEGDRDGE